MTIRAALPADLPAVAEIWNRAIRETGQTFNAQEKSIRDMEDLLAKREADGHALLVAEVDGDILGFGTYGQFRGGVGYRRTMEHTLYFRDAARGKGLGRAMMAALEAHAVDAGAHVMVGGLTAENPESISFHEHLGYARVGVVPQVGYKFGRYMDLVLVQKILT